MNQTKIFDLKNRLSHYLGLVRRGQAVRIYDRDTPVADIVPLAPTGGRDAETAYMAGLELAGIVRTSRRRPAKFLFSQPPGKSSAGNKAVRDLIVERGDE